MSQSVLVIDLDPTLDGIRRPSIVVSEYQGFPSSVVAFDGATGKPLKGWESRRVQPASVTHATLVLRACGAPNEKVSDTRRVLRRE